MLSRVATITRRCVTSTTSRSYYYSTSSQKDKRICASHVVWVLVQFLIWYFWWLCVHTRRRTVWRNTSCRVRIRTPTYSQIYIKKIISQAGHWFASGTKKTAYGVKHNSLAAWPMVCRPKSSGGLGILDFKVQNEGLLQKFLHKFYNHCDLPWVELIWNSYYTSRIPHATDLCGSFWWRDVSKLMPMYRGITQVNVNNGATTLFWKDMWLDEILAETHPWAFSFAKDEDILFARFWGQPACRKRSTCHCLSRLMLRPETYNTWPRTFSSKIN